MPRYHPTPMHKKQTDAREHRLVALGRYRAERIPLWKYAEDFGIARRTAQGDQAEYIRRLVAMSNDAIDFERSRVLHELADLKMDLRDPTISADKKVALALGIIDREVDLLGLNAPTKSIHAHIGETDSTGRFHQFITAASGLSDEQLTTVFQFAKAIQRVPLELPPGPPPL